MIIFRDVLYAVSMVVTINKNVCFITMSLFAVCTKVYQRHRQNGIKLDKKRLNIQIIPQTVTEIDDNCSVELLSCNPDTDPDLLQFYLAALAGNPVSELVFNKADHSFALAKFANELGKYSLCVSLRTLIYVHRTEPRNNNSIYVLR